MSLQVKQDFFDLLSDHHIDVQQRWAKVKDKVETDPRYKAVESSAAREDLYKQYVEKQAKVGVANTSLPFTSSQGLTHFSAMD